MSSYGTKTSSLVGTVSDRVGGKRIDTWQFSRPHPQDDLKNSPSVSVDVHLLSTPEGLVFRLKGTALPPGDWFDTDLQRLKTSVETAFEEQAELLGGIHWEPWLEVVTHLKKASGRQENPGYSPDTGRSLEVSYRPLLRGVHPRDPSRFLTISSTGNAVAFPSPLTPEVDPETQATIGGLYLGHKDGRHEGATYAYLPDTPATRAALDQILSGMEALGDRLHALLSPAQVAASVANMGQTLGGLPLIEAPAPRSGPRPPRAG